jgi:hypothetical protein|tara:strand:- start:121 stop:378 length:258 start_codon:yes stop_codon:yes gene_type:complete
MAYKMKGPSLYKKQVGPRAKKKKVKNKNVPLSPGFEDPIKIQKVQREGLTPNSQKFNKKAKKKTIDFENPKDRNKIYNKTEVKRK